MKNIGLVCLLLVSICCGLQAKKIVKVPYFMACNTRSIEVEQVTLGKDTTWLAVRLYGMQGDRGSGLIRQLCCGHPERITDIWEIPVLPGMSGRIFPLPVK